MVDNRNANGSSRSTKTSHRAVSCTPSVTNGQLDTSSASTVGKPCRPKLPRPDGPSPSCPRCNADASSTKFCYYNNYNIKQPRYYCRACHRHWTAGGTLRKVETGAGKRAHRRQRAVEPDSKPAQVKCAKGRVVKAEASANARLPPQHAASATDAPLSKRSQETVAASGDAGAPATAADGLRGEGLSPRSSSPLRHEVHLLELQQLYEPEMIAMAELDAIFDDDNLDEVFDHGNQVALSEQLMPLQLGYVTCNPLMGACPGAITNGRASAQACSVQGPHLYSVDSQLTLCGSGLVDSQLPPSAACGSEGGEGSGSPGKSVGLPDSGTGEHGDLASMLGMTKHSSVEQPKPASLGVETKLQLWNDDVLDVPGGMDCKMDMSDLVLQPPVKPEPAPNHTRGSHSCSAMCGGGVRGALGGVCSLMSSPQADAGGEMGVHAHCANPALKEELPGGERSLEDGSDPGAAVPVAATLYEAHEPGRRQDDSGGSMQGLCPSVPCRQQTEQERGAEADGLRACNGIQEGGMGGSNSDVTDQNWDRLEALLASMDETGE